MKSPKGYCPLCYKPWTWHKNDLDKSVSRGIVAIGVCKYLDDSMMGYAWGLASRKASRDYATGMKVSNEICGYTVPEYPTMPCILKRGHDDDRINIVHEHGLIDLVRGK